MSDRLRITPPRPTGERIEREVRFFTANGDGKGVYPPTKVMKQLEEYRGNVNRVAYPDRSATARLRRIDGLLAATPQDEA